MTRHTRPPLGRPHRYNDPTNAGVCALCPLPERNHIHTSPHDPDANADAAALTARILGEQPDQED